MSSQYNDTLETKIKFGFTYNNLMNISLIKRIPLDPLDPKDRYFAFISFAKGNIDGNSNRTYDMQNRISQKTHLKDVKKLAFTLHEAARGNFDLLPLNSFTRSEGNQKKLYICKNESKNDKSESPGAGQSNKEHSDPILMGIALNQKMRISIFLSFAEAESIACHLDKIFECGLNYDIEMQAELEKMRKTALANASLENVWDDSPTQEEELF